MSPVEQSSPDIDTLRDLREADVWISKIGGVNAADLKGNADIAERRRNDGRKMVLAISAIRSANPADTPLADPSVVDRDSDGNVKPGFNTTSHLIAAAQQLELGDLSGARELLERVRAFTKGCVEREIQSDALLKGTDAVSALHQAIDAPIDALLSHMDTRPDNVRQRGSDWLLVDGAGSSSITALGEQIAQNVYRAYFEARGIRSGPLSAGADALEAVAASDLHARLSAQLLDGIRNELRNKMIEALPQEDVLIAGGYLPVLASGRGYSDKTGALMAQAAMDAGLRPAYLIEKEFPVMSADPRKIRNAQTVREMTYALSSEVFGDIRGANGGAVHPEALTMLAERDVATYVFNPAHEGDAAQTTYIHRYEAPPGGIEIVATRQVSLGIEITSTSMIGEPGFLRDVTTWFAAEDVSVDQIATSEGSVSFTFNNGGLDTEQLRQLNVFLHERFGSDHRLALRVLHDQTQLYCMGNNMSKSGPMLRAAMGLHAAGTDIHMATQGFNEQVMTFVIQSEQAAEALEQVHRFGIEMSGEEFAARTKALLA